MSTPPNRPIRSADVPWSSFDHGDVFSIRYRQLSAATPPQPYKIGVVIEELARESRTARRIIICMKKSMCSFWKGR